MKQKLAEYAKFVAAILGLAATSFAFAVPPEVAPWLAATVSFLTALAVLLVPNADKPVPAVEPEDSDADLDGTPAEPVEVPQA